MKRQPTASLPVKLAQLVAERAAQHGQRIGNSELVFDFYEYFEGVIDGIVDAALRGVA